MSLAHTIEHYLLDHGARFELEAHPRSLTSIDTARFARIEEDALAKSVVLADGEGFLVAVLPASRRLELDRVRAELGRPLRLCREDEIDGLFPDCAFGAIPPLGSAYGLPTIVDASLEGLGQIFFEGGDHETLVSMAGDAFLDLLASSDVLEISGEPRGLGEALLARGRLHAAVLATGRAVAAPMESEPRWRARLHRALQRLEDALSRHVSGTEGADGLLSEIDAQAPRLWRDVEALRVEHAELAAQCAEAIDLIEGPGSAPALRSRVNRLLAYFERHRQRGADLVYEAFGVDIGGG